MKKGHKIELRPKNNDELLTPANAELYLNDKQLHHVVAVEFPQSFSANQKELLEIKLTFLVQKVVIDGIEIQQRLTDD